MYYLSLFAVNYVLEKYKVKLYTGVLWAFRNNPPSDNANNMGDDLWILFLFIFPQYQSFNYFKQMSLILSSGDVSEQLASQGTDACISLDAVRDENFATILIRHSDRASWIKTFFKNGKIEWLSVGRAGLYTFDIFKCFGRDGLCLVA